MRASRRRAQSANACAPTSARTRRKWRSKSPRPHSRARRQAQFAQTQAQRAQALAAAETERANRLQRELQDLSAQPTDHGLVLVLQDVLFDVGQATLKPGAQSKLDQLA